MLQDVDVMATIAVKDLSAAKKFYEGVLGLGPAGGHEGVLSYRCGSSTLVVYQSRYAGTNQATAATWVLPDVEAVVQTLKQRGARFEHYDLPGLTLQGDLHVAGSFKAAWLKDPDGNILHIVSR